MWSRPTFVLRLVVAIVMTMLAGAPLVARHASPPNLHVALSDTRLSAGETLIAPATATNTGIGALGLSLGVSATQVPAPSALTLGLTLSDSTVSPGETLTIGVSVHNTGGGPVGDFVFAILLPDGSTIVSAGPGVGARFGRLSDLRTLVPVARRINLAGAFQYANDQFFSHTFNGTEPNGTYRIHLAALRSGALDDGAIGAGELLALRTATFVVAPGILTTIDPARRQTAAIPASGGSVSTTAADGVTYELSFAPGSLGATTNISVTPVIAASNLPGEGSFALGVRAEPSGLSFPEPVTLTVTLPDSDSASAEGYTALVTTDDGRELQAVPVLVDGNTLTVTVPHFSDVVLVDSVFFFCSNPSVDVGGPVTPEMREACDVLRAAYVSFGGFATDGFRVFAESALGEWFEDGMKARVDIAEAETPPAGVDQDQVLDTVYLEMLTWGALYRAAFGGLQNGNTGKPLAAAVDYLYAGLAFATSYGQDRANARCLVERSKWVLHVYRVLELRFSWMMAFDEPLLFEKEFCVDLDIDAAPPPVLTPGTPAAMPLAIVARFSDGVELPGLLVSLTITATNATVAPAGGQATLPVFGPVTLTPASMTSRVTITAAFIDDLLLHLPVRTRTFQAGEPPAEVTFTLASLVAQVTLSRSASLGGNITVTDSSQAFGAATTVAATLPATTVTNLQSQAIYNGSGSSAVTRTVTSTPGSTVITTTGQGAASITELLRVAASPSVTVLASDRWCANLSTRFDVTAVWSGELAAPSFFNRATGESVTPQSGVPVRLSSGTWCKTQFGEFRRGYGDTGEYFGPTAGTFGGTITFRPAP